MAGAADDRNPGLQRPRAPVRPQWESRSLARERALVDASTLPPADARRLPQRSAPRERRCDICGSAALLKLGSPEVPRSLIGRRALLPWVASGVRALDFGETVEGPGGDARAIVVQRPCVRRAARVWAWSLGIGRIVWSPNDRRMLEQAGRISVLRRERGTRSQRADECKDRSLHGPRRSHCLRRISTGPA
jgi:hypothetical protein